jgi:thiol-disulfide isomerase/thioredoxin
MIPTRARLLMSLLTLGLVACDGEKPAEDGGTEASDDGADGADGGGDGADGSADGGGEGADGADGADGGADGGGEGEGAAYVDGIQAACTTGEEGGPREVPAARLEALVTWTLDFDATAEATGLTDCSYTRDYSGLQRIDVPHLCHDCALIVEGEAVMTEGADCYAQISGGAPADRTETWALRGLELLRAGAAQLSPGPLATLSDASPGVDQPVAWESDSELTSGGTMRLSATGALRWDVDEDTVLIDPFGPRAEPYACGWECNDPGDLVATWPMTTGEVSPDLRLADACGEDVSMWDFYGSYVVLDASQSDCGPCRSMADTSEAFKAELRAEGIPVRLVNVLGNGLGDVLGTPSAATVDRWISDFDLTEPVLADKGWTYALFPTYLEESTGEDMGYPAWVVIGPDMRVIEGNVGFRSWDDVGAIIRADWEARAGG